MSDCPNCGGNAESASWHDNRAGMVICYNPKGQRLPIDNGGPDTSEALRRFRKKMAGMNWMVEHCHDGISQNEVTHTIIKRKMFADRVTAERWRDSYISRANRGPYWEMFNHVKLSAYPNPTIAQAITQEQSRP